MWCELTAHCVALYQYAVRKFHISRPADFCVHRMEEESA